MTSRCLSLIILALGLNYSGRALAQSSVDHLKGPLLYANTLSSEREVSDWIMEGPGQVYFEEGWMHMHDPDESGHHVFWCPFDFPSDFIAQWEVQNQELDAGLLIIFFAATGLLGEDIFAPNLKLRDGVFRGYTRSDINAYHISYYAHTPPAPNRPHAHLRKNSGFHKVHEGGPPISPASDQIHQITLIKQKGHIRMYLDDRQLIDWIDDGKEFGPVLQGGKIGFRQMQWTHFRYRHFRVWQIKNVKYGSAHATWPMHVIDDQHSGADGVKLYDVDGDGSSDIVTGWEESGLTKLYFYPDQEKVRLNWPGIEIGKTPSVEDAICCDLNNDGAPEIISCSEGDIKQIFVHQHIDQNWRQISLPAAENKMQWMYAQCIQLDGENGLDIVAGGKGKDAALGWFEAPVDPQKWEDWEWHHITDLGWIMSLEFADINKDGHQDIVITDRKGNNAGCFWLQNPGPENALQKPWTRHLIGAEGFEVMFMAISDLNADDYPEVLLTERTAQTVRIYTAQDQSGKSWREQIINLPNDIVKAKAVATGDLNGDGIQDLVITSNTEGLAKQACGWIDGLSLSPDKSPVYQPIAASRNAKYDFIHLVDLDQDDDLDILTCEENYGSKSQGLGIIWYENTLLNQSR